MAKHFSNLVDTWKELDNGPNEWTNSIKNSARQATGGGLLHAINVNAGFLTVEAIKAVGGSMSVAEIEDMKKKKENII
jgi:hypothetical protein